MTKALAMLIVLLSAGLARAADVESGALLRAMREELARSMALSLPGVDKPYYLAFLVLDLNSVHVEARYGKLVEREAQRDRRLLVTARVGSQDLDNTHFISGDWDQLFEAGSVALPTEDEHNALARVMWIATDGAYKRAAEALEGKRAARTRTTEAAERAGDFSPGRVERLVFDEPAPTPDAARFAALVERVSGALSAFPEIQSDSVELWAWRARRYFVSSEGAIGYEPQSFVRLEVACHTQADDGMPLDHSVSFAAASLDGLPAEAELVEAARLVASELTELRKAPPAEAFTGPVLLESVAAAQLVRLLLADELSGTPAPAATSQRMARFFEARAGSELGGMAGRRILPAGFRVEVLPTRSALGKVPLAGGYRMDDEGVRARDVVLVDDGKLQHFVMSRTPRKGVPESNGHGRSDILGGATGRVSNLVVTPGRALSGGALRARLLARVKDDGAPYGLIVRRLGDAGAVLASRVTPDGKEQLVRGGELADLSLRALKDIIAAGDAHAAVTDVGEDHMVDPWKGVHYGPPRTIAAPALLIDELRLKPPKGADRKPPLIPRPAP